MVEVKRMQQSCKVKTSNFCIETYIKATKVPGRRRKNLTAKCITLVFHSLGIEGKITNIHIKV